MELLTLALLIVVLVAVINRNRRSEELLEELNRRLRQLQDDVKELRREPELKPPAAVQRPWSPPPPPVRKPEPLPPPPVMPMPLPSSLPEEAAERAAQPVTVSAPPSSPEPPEPFLTRFLREHPDLEKFIGENLINKVGIAVLVLGIAFFVKYAIDQNWIAEAGRVAIGLGCGALLVTLAHYLRRNYRAFSSVLAGGGIAVFYTTIAFAFHEYQLIPQTPAFLLMVGVTAFGVGLSVLYDSRALAVIAALGGFATPFLVSTGEGNYVVLLTYLCILNGGLLSLAFFKRWPLVNLLAFAGTVLIVGGWIALKVDNQSGIRFLLAFTLISILYVLFLGMNLVYPIRYKLAFRAADLLQLLALAAAYYAAGMTLLSYVDEGAYRGLFTIGTGLLHLALAWYCLRHENTDRNLLYLLIGLTLTFGTLAVPVQLEGHAITLFWSAEFVLLYWLFRRSGIRLFRISSFLLMILAMGSLLLDWMLVPQQGLWLLFGSMRGLVTNIVAAGAFAVFTYLVLQPEAKAPEPLQRLLSWTGACLTALIAYLSAIASVNWYFYGLNGYEIPNVYHRMITAGAALLLGALLRRRRLPEAAVLQLGLTALSLVFYLSSQHLLDALRTEVQAGRATVLHGGAHLLASALYGLLLFRTVKVAQYDHALAGSRNALSWALSAAIILFISLDAGHLYTYLFGGGNEIAAKAQYGRAAMTILWGLCSFTLMGIGMRQRVRTLRIISLSLFLLALLKLFFYDLNGVSEGGKIAAFILLGALLLTVSFMYQRLKKLLIDDKAA